MHRKQLVALTLAIMSVAAASALWLHARNAAADLMGDANCDGTVNAIDGAIILQYAAGFSIDFDCPSKVDVNGAGRIDSIDAALVLQYTAGLIDDLGSGPAATATRTRTRTATRTPTRTPTDTYTATPSWTPTPSATRTNTSTPTKTATATANPSPTPSPTESPPPGTILWDVDPAVSSTEVDLIEQGISLAAEYLDAHLGGRTQGPILVTVATTDICYQGTAVAWRGQISVCVNSPGWLTAIDAEKAKISAHEYFHTLQGELNCPPPPVWIVEGSAEYFGYEVVRDAGLLTSGEIHAHHKTALQYSTPPVPALQEFEEGYGSFLGSLYSVFYFAGERLAEQAGLMSLRTFCTSAANQPWRDAFGETFDQSLAEFYEDFATHRDGLK
jgi:hypothetical protein